MPEAGLHFNPLDRMQRNDRLHQFSHALKNRMGSLWQAASMLYDLPDGPERRMFLEMAEKNFFNGAAELERLMDDFDVPRGITAIQRTPVDLEALLKECVENVEFRTERKQQRVDMADMGAITLNGDRELLRQLFEALLSNASKFSPKGSTIELEAKAADGYCAVIVRDPGAGLSATDLDLLFQRYALLGSRSTDGESQARSTLARAKRWAEVHGGTLEATSEGPGTGSTFTVSLPLA